MTFEEALQGAQDAQRDADRINDAAIDSTGRQAVRELRADTPRDSGELARSWRWRAPRLLNDAPHAPYALDGLAFRMAADVLEGLHPRWRDRVERDLSAVAGW